MAVSKSIAMPTVDLNADVGEWDTEAGPDAELMPFITSANVACGVHAGNDAVMAATVAAAATYGVVVGAHPSLDDREYFGRRELDVTPADVSKLIRDQVAALSRIAADQGIRLKHVKPHGALYNMAARNRQLADAIAAAVAGIDGDLILVGRSGSELIAAGRRLGLWSISEVFADRAYLPDGSLAPRTTPGAVITDPEVVAQRAVALVRDQLAVAVDGTRLPVVAETICIHGDTPGAPALARLVRSVLEHAGVTVSAVR